LRGRCPAAPNKLQAFKNLMLFPARIQKQCLGGFEEFQDLTSLQTHFSFSANSCGSRRLDLRPGVATNVNRGCGWIFHEGQRNTNSEFRNRSVAGIRRAGKAANDRRLASDANPAQRVGEPHTTSRGTWDSGISLNRSTTARETRALPLSALTIAFMHRKARMASGGALRLRTAYTLDCTLCALIPRSSVATTRMDP